MEGIAIAQRENSIQWKQLWSLAALYGSIVIGWIAYQRYQPKLLVQFNFTDFTFLLIVAQGLILAITPPIAGLLGDRYRQEKGHRIPIITAGMSFAAMIFMAVAFTLIGNPGEIFKWILPVLIIFWLIAMSIFTSPALSTMELFTPVDKLPRAMAVLTIVANLLYALEPVIVDIIDFLGAPLTFVTGGVVVAISGYALKKNSLDLFKHQGNKESAHQQDAIKNSSSDFPFIFFLGIALGVATTTLFNLFPDVLERTFSQFQWDGKIMITVILVVSAMLSLPASNIINRFDLQKGFWISLTVNVVSMAAILMIGSHAVIFAMVLLFAISFTTLSVSALPLAISKAAFHQKVFCVGIFFSGVALPDGIVEVWQAALPAGIIF
jgi:MFS family permease